MRRPCEGIHRLLTGPGAGAFFRQYRPSTANRRFVFSKDEGLVLED